MDDDEKITILECQDAAQQCDTFTLSPDNNSNIIRRDLLPEELSREIYLLVCKFMARDERLKDVRERMVETLMRNGMLPRRMAWNGDEYGVDWSELVNQNIYFNFVIFWGF